jgi:hypothetical protein
LLEEPDAAFTWYICRLVGSPWASQICICPFWDTMNKLDENLGWNLSRNAPGGKAGDERASQVRERDEGE